MVKARTPITITPDVHDVADAALAALIAWNDDSDPAVLLRGDVLVRLSRDGDDVRLRPFTEPALTELLSRAAIALSANGAQKQMPSYIAKALLHRTPDDLQGLPRVNRVTDVPVLGADESFDVRPGYHESSRTYFAPAANMGVLPDVLPVTSDDYDARTDAVATARRMLWQLIGEFPFADDASRAHALCMILEPFVRELIGNEPTPMYLVMAHTPGTGKSLLSRVCLGVGCGDVATEVYTNDRDELRKRLTATLIEGRSAVMFDNVRDPVDSPVLAAALTSATWTDRYLGRSAMVEVPVRNVWTMTANNPSLSREMARRCVPIFLDPGDGPDPLKRTDYTHPHLETWARENRAQLVHAAFTLIANWIIGVDHYEEGDVVERRFGTTDFLGSYASWSRVLGGILRASGSKHFLGNLDKLHAEADQDTSERSTLLADWYERTTDELRVDDLASMLQGLNGEYPGEPIPLPLELRGKDDLAKALGYWLKSHKGEIMGGYRVVKHDGRYTKWSVERVS